MHTHIASRCFRLSAKRLNVLKTILGRLRVVGFCEGASFLALLGIAMPLKYFGGMPLAVTVVGTIHGVLWIAYVALIWQARTALKWTSARVWGGLAASVLPFGPFVFDAWLREDQANSAVR